MILITGITGLTGKFLYKKIKNQAHHGEIRYLVRKTSDISWMDKNENIVYGDVQNIEDVISALDGVKIVIHLAHITYSNIISQACIRCNVNRVFYINTTGMYSKYKRYAQSYIELENKIKTSGIMYTIIRPTMIYGNEQDKNIRKLISIIAKTSVFPVIGNGKGLMHPIYAGDLADVIISALINEKLTRLKEYNVAGKYALCYLDLLQEIANALNKQVHFIHIPYRLALFVGRLGDFFPNGLIDYEKVQRIEEDKNFDYSLATEELDFSPMSFKDGIQLEVQALKRSKII